MFKRSLLVSLGRPYLAYAARKSTGAILGIAALVLSASALSQIVLADCNNQTTGCYRNTPVPCSACTCCKWADALPGIGVPTCTSQQGTVV